MTDDRRVIEDYLPLRAISAEASREKNIRKGHPSTLHLWWARRPLVASRAAVYGALVPFSRFVPENGPESKKQSLGRANAAKFIERLCRYPGEPRVLREAEQHILEAHSQRVFRELGTDGPGAEGETGQSLRPKVLDMFAGGAAIPLEGLRLGCESFALDLNPVAHLIQLCTLVYPQRYGAPDPTAKGTSKGGTWAGLAAEVRHWGGWVLERVRREIGDLYPSIPDPDAPPEEPGSDAQQRMEFAVAAEPGLSVSAVQLTPVAYLWTRTVICKNPACGAEVPLVRQTWLCRKDGRYVALRITAPIGEKRVRFHVVETTEEGKLGFDPEDGSKGGNATCWFCGTVADSDHVKAEGQTGRLGRQLMAIACTRRRGRGKVYLAAPGLENAFDDRAVSARIEDLCRRTGLSMPSEPIVNDAKQALFCVLYGLKTWADLFTPRQMLALLTFAAAVRDAEIEMGRLGHDQERIKAAVTFLAAIVDRLADFNSSGCTWNYTGGRGVKNTFTRQALPMVWDFAETNPFNPAAASWISGVKDLPAGIANTLGPRAATVVRGSATALPWSAETFDAVVTDPPYYDNVPYADISDFFYVWLKRTVGHLYPEHFASEGTPKRAEAVADATRHGGSKDKARQAYEKMMFQAFREAHRVLKSSGSMVVVYAHKTTLGWTTLVNALRDAGFMVTEAWPLDTEKAGRVRAQDSAALASSIFLVARKRDGTEIGRYEDQVRPELHSVVTERVGALWEQGVSGADLVIACVGAGLRAFSRYATVEYANGEPVPAERFLIEVETGVLEAILDRLSKEAGGPGETSLAGLDRATRCYTLWRYTYGSADLEAGEAIIFANGTHVELDGSAGLSSGPNPLVQKIGKKYRLRDYGARGMAERMGLPDGGRAAPMIDVLHRTLWLMENCPQELPTFLREVLPNREQMRLVAQALVGPALKGGELAEVSPSAELAALAKLTANWRAVVENAPLSEAERQDKKSGQRRLGLG